MRAKEEVQQPWKFAGLLLIVMPRFSERIIFTAAGL